MSPYLFDIVTEEDEVDTAETQLGDDQKHVHYPPEGKQEERTQINLRSTQRGLKTQDIKGPKSTSVLHIRRDPPPQTLRSVY